MARSCGPGGDRALALVVEDRWSAASAARCKGYVLNCCCGYAAPAVSVERKKACRSELTMNQHVVVARKTRNTVDEYHKDRKNHASCKANVSDRGSFAVISAAFAITTV